jgi:hypothetical protein
MSNRSFKARLYDSQGKEIIHPTCKKCRRKKNIVGFNGTDRVFFCDTCDFLTHATKAVVFDYCKKYWRKKHKEASCGWTYKFPKVNEINNE